MCIAAHVSAGRIDPGIFGRLAGAQQQFDVVVVGAGTGMLAALTAAEAGLSVLVIEKSEYVGGSTALSGGGFWIPMNHCDFA